MSNSRRFHEFDFLRSIPMLLLPFVHCFEEALGIGILSEKAASQGIIWEYLCAIGPSVFIILAGMNLAFSEHATPRALVKRGFTMLIASYLLNLARFSIPAVVAAFISGKFEIYLGYSLILFLNPDILFFAGGMFFFFALMKKWKVSPLNILLITLVMLTIHTPLSQTLDRALATEFLGGFVHLTDASAFPWLSWMIFPAIGYQIGSYMKTLETDKDIRAFDGKLMLVSAVVFAAFFVVIENYGLNAVLIAASPVNSYTTDLFNVILDASLSLVIIGSAVFTYGLFKSERTCAAIDRVSGCLTVFYVLQWVFVGWTEFLLAPSLHDTQRFGSGAVLLYGASVTAISLAIALPVSKKLNARKKVRRASAQTAAEA